MREQRERLMKYTVHQINLTDEQVDEVNSSDTYPAFYTTYLNTTFQPRSDAILDAINAGMYKPVAYIEADDHNGVFHIGNLGPEDKIERLDQMHSVSVGDIIEDDKGDIVYVDSCGFGEI